MIANLMQLLAGRPAPEVVHRAFVCEVDVRPTESRNARLERLILVCWLLITLKHAFVLWAVARYPVPFSSLWVNFPTWLLGVLATGVYYGRVRRRRP